MRGFTPLRHPNLVLGISARPYIPQGQYCPLLSGHVNTNYKLAFEEPPLCAMNICAIHQETMPRTQLRVRWSVKHSGLGFGVWGLGFGV